MPAAERGVGWGIALVLLAACRHDEPAPESVADASAPRAIPPAASGAGRRPRERPPVDDATIALVASASVRRHPPSTLVLDAATRKALCDARDGVLPKLRFVPQSLDGGSETANGPWSGIRVYGVKPDSLAGRLGLENGDLVVRLGDMPLDAPAAAEAAIVHACGAAGVIVHVARTSADAGAVDLQWIVSDGMP